VDAVEPGGLVRAALEKIPDALAPPPTHVVAAGKAASAMFAAAAERYAVRAAVLATPSLSRALLDRPGVEAFAAGHPAPNRASVAAGERALSLAREARGAQPLLVLLSGGASAMLAAPASDVGLEEKVETSRRLMAAGAAIHELNCVRKHLSRIKGGRLAAAAGRTVTLALSDVHGPVPDDPAVIGSGPTVPDDTTFTQALDIVRARGVTLPPGVLTHLERGARGQIEETLKPGDPRMAGSVYTVIGNRHTAVEGAKREAARLGYVVAVVPAASSGEACRAGEVFALEAVRAARAGSRPLCVLGSGETTVTVRGNGLGGRNQEFALGLAAAVARIVGPSTAWTAASAGTDGIDGPTTAAGALVDATTLERAARLGLVTDSFLARNDTFHFFEPLADLIVWGPTGTNVGDLHVMVIDPGTIRPV
jgi:glycerate-2-kinase